MNKMNKKFVLLLCFLCSMFCLLAKEAEKTDSTTLITENMATEKKLKTTKVEKVVVDTYQKIEDGVVGAYQKVEDAVVGTYKKVEDKFVDTFLEDKEK